MLSQLQAEKKKYQETSKTIENFHISSFHRVSYGNYQAKELFENYNCAKKASGATLNWCAERGLKYMCIYKYCFFV